MLVDNFYSISKQETNATNTCDLTLMALIWSLPTSAQGHHLWIFTQSKCFVFFKLSPFIWGNVQKVPVDRSVWNFCTSWDSFWIVYSLLHRCLSGITALFNTQLHPRSHLLADYFRFPSKYCFSSSMFDCRSVLGLLQRSHHLIWTYHCSLWPSNWSWGLEGLRRAFLDRQKAFRDRPWAT